ncbi:polysaccharide biosynthesis tyrosine autokinase [Phormidium sp. LEGE 05292]|uniref:GumC family protein n=1 Tax=[Phormidium] sp. LEGE 05292 TaxID=767427 RepID=UPI00187F1B5F|nr:tyrosine-protein kinase family protein [Phormidium sp. LEGE 05292]MBE9225654.1 polysaccharide biosynthesis tyrosine autokinase [Phormidium sp. LEGE 05292]
MKIKPYSQPIFPNNNNGKNLHSFPYIYPEQVHEEDANKLELRQVFGILRRRALVVASVAIAVATVAGTRAWNTHPLYEGKFRVLVEPITAETKVAQNFGAIVYSILDYDTQTEVLRSPSVMDGIIKKIQVEYPDISYGSLMPSLVINRLGSTKIIEVRYQDSDPKRAENILQIIADGYLNYSRQQRQTDVRQGIDFVQQQLPSLQARVNTLQAKLQKFRQEYNFIDPEQKAQDLGSRISGIQQQQVETNTKLNELRSLYILLQGQLGLQPSEAIVASALSEAPRYQKLLTELQDVETKLATESVRFTEDSPMLDALKQKRQKLLPLIAQESQRVIGNTLSPGTINTQRLSNQNSIRLSLTKQFVDATNEIKVSEVRSQALKRTEELLVQEFKQMPVRAREYTDLQRELKVTTESLLRFLSTRENLEIEAAQKATPWQLIDAPNQSYPISANKYRNLMLGVIAGLLLGAGAAWLVEMLDSVFHSAEDLKNQTGMPLLGIIPFSKLLKKVSPGETSEAGGLLLPQGETAIATENSQVHSRYNASQFVESFRSLYTNIRLLTTDMPIRSLVISSSTPAEGKTVVSLHLAQAAAAMGQRVLLVDADLRRPQIHKRLGVANMRGLTNLISSEDLDFHEVIQSYPEEENLYIMTAGQIPPDPTRLLSSEKMQSLMADFQSAFDLVIYDTPPLVGFADASILATPTDGVILVVGLGKADRYPLMQALDTLKISGTPILGLVANGVKSYTTRWHDSYNRYYNQSPVNQRATQQFTIDR